jgi:4-hydroxybenzoate polyprenyltransferase
MKYPFSTLIQFTGCFIPFLAGVTSVGTLTLEAIVLSSAFGVLAVVHRFQHEMANYKADVETGKETIAVEKGFRTANLLRKLSALVGVAEFALFLAFGWINAIFALLFILYVAVCIAPMWFRFVPKPLKIIPSFINQFSGFILLFVVLGLFGKLGPLHV